MWKLLAKQFPNNIQKHTLEKNNKKIPKGNFYHVKIHPGQRRQHCFPRAPAADTAVSHTCSGFLSFFSLLPVYHDGGLGSIYVYLN